MSHTIRYAADDLPRFEGWLEPDFWQDPYPTFAEAHREPVPLHGSAVGGLVVLGYDAAGAIARDQRFGVASSKEALGTLGVSDALIAFFSYSLLSINPPEHTERKAIVGRRFGAKRVSELTPLIEATVSRLLDELLEAREADFLTTTAAPLATRSFCAMLEIPREDEELLESWTSDLGVGLKLLPTPEDNHLGGAAAENLIAYLTTLGEKRLGNPGNDVLTLILRGFIDAGHPDPLRLAVATFAQVMFDGIDTVKHILGNSLYTLLKHPKVWASLAEEPSLIPSAIEEMLRYESSAFLTARRALEEVDFEGVSIPAGTQLALIWPAANRDARRFENPNAFDIRRENNRHVAFGAGRHFCSGAGLARIQMRAFYEAFLARVSKIELSRDDLRWTEFQLTRGLTELPIRVLAR